MRTTSGPTQVASKENLRQNPGKFREWGINLAIWTLFGEFEMRLSNHVAALGLVSMLTVSSVSLGYSQQPVLANQVQALQTGAFISAEHPTEGKAHIVTREGKNYLVLDEAFKSDDGPDLFVLLHRSQSPQSYAEQDYVSLGRLQNVSGQQWYEIPADVDPATFQSAVIWCRQFNATFGYAPFKS